MNARRPSPLPKAPASESPGEVSPTPSAVPVNQPRTPMGDPGTPDEHDTDVIVPLRLDEDQASAVAEYEASDGAIGVGDVWRAARARRKALRREVRRFTARSRRRRRIWLATTVALVGLVLASAGIAYSPLFALEKITVVGAEALPAQSVEAALAGQLGKPLPLIDESAIKQALIGFPLVESYTLEARPPHDLVVRIVERTPIGVVDSPGGWSVVDAAGVVLSTTETTPEGMPVIDVEGGVDSAAFESVALVMRALPENIRAQVTSVSASTRDDVTLELGGTDTSVVWGSVEGTPAKALNLETAMTANPPANVSVYDVSSTTAVVIR